MITIDQQTLTILGTFLGVAVALAGVMIGTQRSLRTDLKGDIGGLRTELKTDIAELRTDLKSDIAGVRSDIGRLDGRLTTIEQRTYDLSTRWPPASAASSTGQ